MSYNNFSPPFDLNTFAQEHHAAMVAKGFWENGLDIYEKANLIGEEIGELVSAHRAGTRVDPRLAYNKDEVLEYFGEGFPDFYEGAIKGGMEEELADIVLRTLDLGAKLGATLGLTRYKLYENLDFHRLVSPLFFEASTIPRQGDWLNLNSILSLVAEISDTLGIDLWLHVQLKREYNASRPHKHGKNY